MGEVRIQRARIEEIKPLAGAYRAEAVGASSDGQPWDPPIPQGGIFWIARDGDDGRALGYAAGTLRRPSTSDSGRPQPGGCLVGPVFTSPEARRRGVGEALVTAIQQWAIDTRVPVVEISVAADNPEGQAFLESLGYVPRRILMSLTPQVPDAAG